VIAGIFNPPVWADPEKPAHSGIALVVKQKGAMPLSFTDRGCHFDQRDDCMGAGIIPWGTRSNAGADCREI
jgi:hypothetical protein